MAKISDFCQLGRHNQCPVQRPYDRDYPNSQCQCDCHSGTIPATFAGDMGTVDKT